jgi:hypothetical protein
MLSVAVTAICAVPAFATTTISDKKTEEVKTSTANSGAADNVTISSNGSIVINAAGPALLIDSANVVDHQGTISNKNTTGAQGIVIDASGGPYTVPSGSTSILNDNGTIDLTGTGTGKTGVIFKGGKYTGDIVMQASSVTTITGDGSVGVAVLSGSTLDGKLDILGDLLVQQTKASDTTAGGIFGVKIDGTVNKDVTVGGHLTASGQGAFAVVVAPTASILGTFKNVGTVFATGIATPSTKVANPEASGAISIQTSVAGGFYNAGPTVSGDTTTAGVISLAGEGSAVFIGASAADVTIGSVPTAIDSTNAAGYGFINRGSISAAPVDLNSATQIVGVNIGGSSSFKTTLTNGLLNTGTISASSNSGVSGLRAESATSAIALELNVNAIVPKIVNQALGSSGGQIASSISGTQGGSAIAIAVASGASPTGNIEIQNLTGSKIAASATTTDSTIAALNAIAINDASGKVNAVLNEGTISAVTSALDNAAQKAIAMDLHVNTTGVTVTNGDINHQGSIVGDILLGSGADTVTVSGLSNTAYSTIAGVLNFGSNVGAAVGTDDQLTLNPFASVASALVSSDGHLNVLVSNNSILNVNNAVLPAPAPTILHNLLVNSGGELDLTIAEGLSAGVIQARNDGLSDGQITIQSNANFNVKFGSFLTTTNNFVLLDAPNGNLVIPDADIYKNNFTTPFLFTGGLCTLNVAAFAGTATECAAGTSTSTHSQLILSLAPKTVGTGPNQLDLKGYAAQLYSIVNQVLPNDNTLGAAVVTNVTNLAEAQKVYDSFAPMVNGGSRGLAIAFTDQATGPIGARQRVLRTYGKQAGESTLWGVEYAQFLKDPGDNSVSGYKDHGFGFSLGADGGNAHDGWYGGALSFYTGDIGEIGDRAAQTQSEWYMLSGYTDWRGKGFFFDSNIDVGVTQYKGKRHIDIDLHTTPDTFYSRTATSKHIGVFLAGGVTTGAILKYAGTTITPKIAIDGLTMRENGYTESGGGPTGHDGFDLAVGASYTNSLRSLLGVDLRQDIDMGDFFLQPEARVGYRYDFIGTPQKVTANFVSLPGSSFTVQGPDPAQGNLVAGATIAASTDTWSIGIQYDWVRGTNGMTQQSGQFVLVGRI